MNFTRLKELLINKNLKIVFGILILLFVGYLIFKPKPKQVQFAEVTNGTYQNILKEQCITHIKEMFTLFSPVNGILRRIQKHTGEEIKKGEVLAEVDWDNLRKVKSPTNGRILKIYRDSEGPVMMGEKLMDVGDTSEMEITAYLLTEDTTFLNVKDKVILSGYGEKEFYGEVNIIEPSAITKISSLGVEEQRVPIKISFNSPEGMGDGYELECKIILFEKTNAILVPTSALFRIEQDWAVFVVEKKRARLRIVKIESHSSGIANVSEGLKSGETVILFPGESIVDGSRVIDED